ncbi:hypothetical protein Gogos_015035 [Gossypium gossypioides]|uniref:Josephin-like protein n=1 Tax=Gossypium gossypioides TaxID=34282 RepID=A0A7J9C0I1_GOSGO|nr:hypothetical protein [Gossypium gossypioides]
MEKKTRGSPKIMKSSILCMPGFKSNNKNNKRLSPVTLLERFREAVFRLIMLSALSKASHHHHHHHHHQSSSSTVPRRYYPADAHHNEAVADCIEFIKKKSSRESRASSSNMDAATSEIVMPVPVM